ncbi:conserved hypothetical protein [Talaromyces stipitatus ATCC 10500]|uniref:Uncharacterized protein n=1 Tax=Talaromyces stipitatus (strain ATCC 10500 / CBS 375.48 / QM 6759 / NRRL 1006) TaxID=441959 RepID=B8MK61_TALSN|nr:uncharacterized protein TSTA_043490 [Talaromyces stipitatus ATCC 10500]EED14878.1 conserved hypothetical protein [Talaromyces stipitatus ATCC 10500]
MENGEELSPQTAINTTQNDDRRTTERAHSNSASSSHRRSVSGSLLSKLSFLRMSQSSSSPDSNEVSSTSREIAGNLNDGDPATTTNDGYVGGSRTGGGRAMGTAIQHQRKMRRRRGSLRKTALLERRNSNSASTARDQINYGSIENSRGVSSPLSTSLSATSMTSPSTTLTDEELTPRGSMDHDGGHASVYSGYWTRSPTMDRDVVSTDIVKSPTSTGLIGDTTDEEEESLSSFNHNNNPTTNTGTNTGRSTGTSTHLRPSSVSSSGSINPPPIATPSSSSESYFLSSHHHHHRHHHHHQTTSANETTDATTRPLGRSPSTHRARSPLIAPDLPNSVADSANTAAGPGAGWDYSETEWWGWIILIVTWLVFVIGIGSSFGVWSWAWDVGETPYAPPELEDDPTLPIVGYYPALMVLTAVMAWVWVVVAWVGMKYFKHANIAADDG